MIFSFHLMLSSRWILSWSCGSGCKHIRCLRNINVRCCWWCCNRGNHWGWKLSRHNGWLTIFGYIIIEYHRRLQLDWDIWLCLPCPQFLVAHLGVAACDARPSRWSQSLLSPLPCVSTSRPPHHHQRRLGSISLTGPLKLADKARFWVLVGTMRPPNPVLYSQNQQLTFM